MLRLQVVSGTFSFGSVPHSSFTCIASKKCKARRGIEEAVGQLRVLDAWRGRSRHGIGARRFTALKLAD
jgi:hypothetical protein